MKGNMSEEKDIGKIITMKYLQNRTNWCWAVACKIVGKQFVRNNPQYHFSIVKDLKGENGFVTGTEYENGVVTENMQGLRNEIVKHENEVFFVDAWQYAIVKNVFPGCDGNMPGDDGAKEKGLKYVITGLCDTNRIQTVTVGDYDSMKSLLHFYWKPIVSILSSNNYLIGNALLYPKCLCHSFVLMGWTIDNKILLYDPWDGKTGFFTIDEVFYSGFSSALGRGIIKWIQYINS